jgi:hypothetical protein
MCILVEYGGGQNTRNRRPAVKDDLSGFQENRSGGNGRL